MTKVDAEVFSRAGEAYLGQKYKKMDCQAFVEKCMADCGLRMDLGGSNSWYREVMANGWCGTPEDCRRIFGQIPKGALLFIWAPVDEKTPAKFRKDGIGDIKHIGIKTGTDKGAIHSSESRGGVCHSAFEDKTIPNGGWNRVGLYNRFTYGKSVDWVLNHIRIGNRPEASNENGSEEEQAVARNAIAFWVEGTTVNLRKTKGGDLLDRVPIGDPVVIVEESGEWSKVKWKNKTGWMMTKFLEESGGETSAESGSGESDAAGERIALYFSTEELQALLPILENATNQIVEKIGRG